MADKLSRKRTVGDPPTSAQRFARNALWLIALNLFLRTVGVSFNVYLAGRAGGEVMGLYSLILGVYGFFTTLGGGGAHLGCTRLIAETMGRFPERDAPDPARQAAISHVLRVSLGYALLCGVGAGVMLFPAAPYIGRVWLGDLRTIPSLRVLALSLPVVSLSGCLSGYFTGMRRVALPSLTGVVSQVLRLSLCAALLGAWLPRGASYACLALVVGSSLAETAGLVLSALACLFEQRRHGGRVRNERLPTGKTHLLSRLLHITVPVTVAACLRSGLLTLQHALIPRGLRAVGASWSAALASYGVIHGVVLPVVLFPSVFVSSFSGLLVPEIAEANARGHHRRVAHVSGRVVSVALLFSFGAAGLMCCFSAEIGQLVCSSREAGAYIRILAPLIPIMYVDSSVDGVLKGMGQQVYSMTVNIIDALTSVILVWFLLPHGTQRLYHFGLRHRNAEHHPVPVPDAPHQPDARAPMAHGGRSPALRGCRDLDGKAVLRHGGNGTGRTGHDPASVRLRRAVRRTAVLAAGRQPGGGAGTAELLRTGQFRRGCPAGQSG